MVQSIFTDADEYDLLHQDIVDDIPFFVNLTEKVGSPVLELGCGTGRIALPIARRGVEVVGMDISPSMVGKAMGRAKGENLLVRCFVGDMRRFALKRRFPLVIVPFNAFSHLYTLEDIRSFFESVSGVLDEKGRLVVDIFNPDADILRGSTVRRLVGSYTDTEGRQVVVYGTSWYDARTQINHVKWYFTRGDKEWVREFTMRVFFPQEVMNYARFMGFEVEGAYGDYNGEDIIASSPRILLILRKG